MMFHGEFIAIWLLAYWPVSADYFLGSWANQAGSWAYNYSYCIRLKSNMPS